MPQTPSTIAGKKSHAQPHSQPQSQLNMNITKAAPGKKRKQDVVSQTNAKKQRTQALGKANELSVSQKNHRTPARVLLDDSEENNEGDGDDGFEPGRQKSSSRSTLSNDEDNNDEELETFEKESALLKNAPAGASKVQPSGFKPDRTNPKDLSKDPFKETPDKVSTISADTRVTFDKLAIRCRLMYLTKFKLVPHATIIRAVWGDAITKQDWEWRESNDRVSWNGSNWKLRSVQNMESKIRDYIKNDVSNTLESISEYKPLARFFASKYSPSAFSWVFDFTNGCVDITESDEKPALHYYFKNIWTNFATRVKLYMDWCADPQALHNSEHSRGTLLAWVPVMAKSDKYRVDIKDFVRVKSKERRHRHGSAGPVEPDDNTNYLFLGTPPPE